MFFQKKELSLISPVDGKVVPLEAVPDEVLRNEALDLFMDQLEEKFFSFSSIIEIVEDALSLKHGSAISLFKELVLSGRLYLDLDRPLNFMNPLAKEA